MTPAENQTIELRYGFSGHFTAELDDEKLFDQFSAPAACSDLQEEISSALKSPLDFPPLENCVIPDDQVVIVLDPETPSASVLTDAVCQLVFNAGISQEKVTILLPAGTNPDFVKSLVSEFSESYRDQIKIKIHDEQLPNGGSYLASSSSGERIYLAPELIDADMIIPIGQIAFDPMLGYRGNFSTIYPGMSSEEAIKKSHGQPNSELEPDDERQLRQLIEEVGWLLGIQFTVQVVAAAQSGVHRVLAGASESVFRTGKKLLEENWTFNCSERADTVIVAVEPSGTGKHGWKEVCAAIDTARRLVYHDGKIIVLSQLKEEPEAGIKLYARGGAPLDVMGDLRELQPVDLIPTTQLARASDWARIYLLSELDADFLEDLFVTPLESKEALGRLLKISENCLVINSAQSVHGYVEESDF